MKTALFDVQSSLFDGLQPGEQELGKPAGLEFEVQRDGSQRAVLLQPEAPTMLDTSAAMAEAAPEGRDSAGEEAKAEKPGFTAMWQAYLQVIKDCEKRIREVKAQRFGSLSVGRGVCADISSHYMLSETMSSIIRSIYNLAEATFAPEGGTLKIERLTINLGEENGFDPDQLWEALERQYGGEAGVELARKQLGRVLVDEFGLKRREPVRRQNYLQIEQRMYAEKKIGGGWEYTYGSIQSIRHGLNALGEFCSWAGDQQTSLKVFQAARNVSAFEVIESRKRTEMGAVHTVSFKERLMYELHGDLGDRFHEFIAVYGADALQEKE